jgi:hypothetical protein
MPYRILAGISGILSALNFFQHVVCILTPQVVNIYMEVVGRAVDE